MVHQGSDLVRKKGINPPPKKADTTHYRDLVSQNEWLRQHLFDAVGNYLYCQRCIRSCFGISSDRLFRQRTIVRSKLNNPIVNMTKAEVVKQRLSEYVIMPDGIVMSFSRWWRSVEETAELEVRFTHERHGNAGKTSNHAKSSVKEEFLQYLVALITMIVWVDLLWLSLTVSRGNKARQSAVMGLLTTGSKANAQR